MATYTDLFVRSNLSDDGTIPRTGAQSSSPDIIPWGMTPQANPQTFFAGNYSSDVGNPLVVGAQNYLYVRAKNLGANASTGTVKLFWAPSSLLLYPSQWQGNAMTTSGGASSSQMTNVAKNAIGVTTDPFTWKPVDPPSGQHYCCVAQVATPANPNAIPATGSITDFAAWVAGAGGIGWRNVAVVDAGAPTLSSNYVYNQGVTGATVQFQLTVNGAPAGSSVSFSSGTPTTPGGSPVGIPKSSITTPPGTPFVIGTSATIPANWQTTFTINYWAGGPPLPNWSVTLLGLIIVTGENGVERLVHLAHPLAHFGIQPHHIHYRYGGVRETFAEFEEEHAREANGPARGIIIGSGKLVNGTGGL